MARGLAGPRRVRIARWPERRPKIVIVDDDRDTREMLTLALDLEGFDVASAANGLRLLSSLHVDRPDVILLDVVMSWIDGYELCRSVKKNEEFRDIPVIFVSARKGPEDLQRGIEAGASDYFTKPVDIDRLLARLRELVKPPAPAAVRALHGMIGALVPPPVLSSSTGAWTEADLDRGAGSGGSSAPSGRAYSRRFATVFSAAASGFVRRWCGRRARRSAIPRAPRTATGRVRWRWCTPTRSSTTTFRRWTMTMSVADGPPATRSSATRSPSWPATRCSPTPSR